MDDPMTTTDTSEQQGTSGTSINRLLYSGEHQ
jgi:hypothetical protein